MSLSAHWAGFETVAFVEIDPYCQKVLRKNFGKDIIIHDDIKKLDATQYAGRVDLLCGGWPCQPYSVAGKRKGDADPRALWGEMFRIIKECKPTWIVGENVFNFVNMGLDSTIADLESEGYEVIPFVIPAVAIGAPHLRNRVFIVAWNSHGGNRNKGSLGEIQGGQNPQSTGIRDNVSYAEGTRTEPNDRGLRARVGGIDRGARADSEKISESLAYSNNNSKPGIRETVSGRENQAEPNSKLGGGSREWDNLSGTGETTGIDANATNKRTSWRKRFKANDASESEERGYFRGRSHSDDGSQDIPDSTQLLRNGGDDNREQFESKPIPKSGNSSCAAESGGDWEKVESRVGRVATRLPRELDGYWRVEPDIPRVTSETKNRTQRLKGLGNAVVPQQVYPILKLIYDIESGANNGNPNIK